MKLIDEILAKVKSRVDSAEVFQTRSESLSCEWNSNNLKLAEVKETSGLAIRVVSDGKVGFFATSKMDEPDRIIDHACDLAKVGSYFAGEFPKSFVPADVDIFHGPTEEADANTLVEIGNEMISKASDARSDAMFDSKINRTILDATIANTNGAHGEFRKTMFTGHLMGQVAREGDVLILWEFDTSTRIAEQPNEWAETVIKKLNDASKIVTLPAGEYPCIITPMAMDMFNPIRLALNARNVLKDMSPFRDKVGEKIFDERVTLIDDGLAETMVATQPIDDEGVTCRKTPLVEAGVLKGFIHDLHTAKKMEVDPTGNGMKGGLAAAPRAGFTTLSLMPGKTKLADMISGIEKGVLIDQIMGAHQSSPFSGDFSVSVGLGFVIENGKIIGRFKDGMMAGNVFRMLKDQLVDIGSDMKNATLYAPPLLFDKITIATG